MLEGGYPEVIKVPGRQGRYIRVSVSVNAEWYRRFCKRYLTTRRRYPKPRTLIRRHAVVRGLKNLIRGRHNTVYAQRLIDFIDREAS